MMKSNVMPSEKPPSKIQRKILQIAKKKFAKNGYQKTSMNEIVATAGVREFCFTIFAVKRSYFFKF